MHVSVLHLGGSREGDRDMGEPAQRTPLKLPESDFTRKSLFWGPMSLKNYPFRYPPLPKKMSVRQYDFCLEKKASRVHPRIHPKTSHPVL